MRAASKPALAVDLSRRTLPRTRKRRRKPRRRRPRSVRGPEPVAVATPAARRASRDARSLIAGLEQRHLDVIGLALVAAGVYLGCVLYVGWDGGPVGEWLERALENAAGRIAYVVPLALAGWGMALVMRPFIAAPGRAERGGGAGARLAALGLRGSDRRAGARPSRAPRLLRAALLHRPRRGRRRGAVLGRDDALPAPRGTDPGRPDVRQRRAAAHRNHGRGPPVRRRAGRAERRRRDARAGEDGARSAARASRASMRAGDEIAITRAGPTEPLAAETLAGDTGRGRDRGRGSSAITTARVGRG